MDPAAGGGGMHEDPGNNGGGGVGGSGGAPVDADLLSISPDSTMERDPVIAVAGTRVVVAWNAFTSSSAHIGYRVSEDGGQSWGDIERIDAEEDRTDQPSLASGPDGTIYLTWTDLDVISGSQLSGMNIQIAEMGPTESVFGTPDEVNFPTGFHEDSSVHVTADGEVHVVWRELESSRIRHGVQSGQSFSTDSLLSGSVLPSMCEDPITGELFAVYSRVAYAGAQVFVNRYDGWNDWPEVVFIDDDDVTVNSPTCIADDGEIWVVYAVSDGAAGSGMASEATRIVHYADLAESPLVTDVVDPGATLLTHPAVLRDSTGAWSLLTYGGQMDPDPNGALRLLHSSDGVSWDAGMDAYTPLTFLVTTPSDPTRLGEPKLAATSNGLLGVFLDNTSGLTHVRLLHNP